MTPLKEFEARLTAAERQVWRGLTTPAKIQAFLDEVPYSGEERYRCPLTFMRDGTGHCFDGALFAAAALRRLGHPPLIVDLLPGDDDDHILALFKLGGHWGAVAKSNFATLRFREPVYRTLRELVMTYFEGYFNVKGEKTLRGYTRPLDLAAYDRVGWMWSDERLDDIGVKLGEIKSYRVLTPAQIRALQPVDKRSFEAGTLGLNIEGVYRPRVASASQLELPGSAAGLGDQSIGTRQ
jgi:hypothetical protein